MRLALALALSLLAALALLPGPLAATGKGRACTLSLEELRVSDGCRTVAADTAGRRNPLALWGRINCESRRRHQRVRHGGDHHRKANGARQRNRSYRRLRVLDGDDFYGERCELGRNTHDDPTFARYREGQRRVTFVSLRLPRGFSLGDDDWQTVWQMKQSQPAAAGDGAPILEMQARDGKFLLINSWNDLWSTDARKRRWIRFAIDVRYSRDPDRGFVRVFMDANGDGDAKDGGERSGRYEVPTLRREVAGGFPDGISPGQSIPSHFRTGIYHDPDYDCSRPRGCPIDVDNVQVVDP
jgi:Polysaccharide lyase